MKDRFRTPEDGKASAFDPSVRDRQLYNVSARILPFILLPGLIFALVYLYGWGRGLSKRIESLEGRPESREGGEEAIQRQLADLSRRLDEIEKRVDSIKIAEVTGGSQEQGVKVSINNVQEWLQKLGYYRYTVDGLPGKNTKEAVCSFQISEMSRSSCSVRDSQDKGFLQDTEFLVRLKEKARGADL